MYAVMFLNVDDSSHIYLSLTRFYMTLLMVSPMAVLMLLLMPMMYTEKKKNNIILMSSTLVFVAALVGLRNQVFVSDSQYMKAMIPHHSSAIMVSRKSNLQDPELKKLSKGIIESQKKEIAEMKAILERIESK